jgi:uncharacterized membrane protein
MPPLSAGWPLSLLAVAVAIGLGGWAISISSSGAHSERDHAHFTELWVLPVTGGGANRAISVGVANHQGNSSSYQLEVTHGDAHILARSIRLENGERWHTVLALPGITRNDPVEVELLRNGRIYRRAYLESGRPL